MACKTWLGPFPLGRALAYWAAAAVLCAGVWELGQRFPVAGLIAIGLSPFVALYLFFRGLGLLARCPAYWLTCRKAKRLGLNPDWGSCGGGYLLVDETQGVWVGNGVNGAFADLALIRCASTGQAYRLELLLHGADRPAAVVGMASPEELCGTARRLHQAVCRREGTEPVLDEADSGTH